MPRIIDPAIIGTPRIGALCLFWLLVYVTIWLASIWQWEYLCPCDTRAWNEHMLTLCFFVSGGGYWGSCIIQHLECKWLQLWQGMTSFHLYVPLCQAMLCLSCTLNSTTTSWVSPKSKDNCASWSNVSWVMYLGFGPSSSSSGAAQLKVSHELDCAPVFYSSFNVESGYFWNNTWLLFSWRLIPFLYGSELEKQNVITLWHLLH